MVLLWTNPIGFCLFLHLLAGFKSQIKFKTKFNSVPITEPKKISSLPLNFDDQAEVFRSVFFQKRKPRLSLFKSAKFPFGAEPSPATEKPEIPSSVSREHKDVSDVLVDEKSTEASTVGVDEQKKSSSESTTELSLDGSTKTADLQGTASVVKANTRFLKENLFQRPRSSLLASSRGKKRKVSSFFRSGEQPRSELSNSSFQGKESKQASPITETSESLNESLSVPTSSLVANTKVIMKKGPFLDKVEKTPDVKFSNDEATATEGSPKESFGATDLSRSPTEVEAKHLNENLFRPQKSSVLALSRGKTPAVTTASSFRRSSITPSRATLVQGSNSIKDEVEEKEDIIAEMMKDVFLDTLKQTEANSGQYPR